MTQNLILVLAAIGLIVLGVASYRVTQDTPDTVPAEQVVVEADERAPAVQEPSVTAPPVQEEESSVPETPVAAPEPEPLPELVLPENATIEQRFEFTLNTMLRGVATKTREYKKQRKVLKELTKEENLGNKTYVAENFQILQELVPELREKAGEILGVFEKADAEIRALAGQQPEEARTVILEKWQAMKREQAGAYEAFFRYEHDVIQAHDRLLRFYFNKQEAYSTDPVTGAIVFENENDRRLARQLRLRINRLERTQNSVLAGN